ncbi:MAG: hypothetical protein IPL52_03760 [Flavobacteriales bacterium]|nr:hypothetical protein [Flavobacteriales bacterium]
MIALFTACDKGELDTAPLTTNPFDPDYNGANLFEYDTTFTELITFPNGAFLYQVIEFKVREELFLSPSNYTVRVHDEENGTTTELGDSPANSAHFIYRRPEPVIGAPVCLGLSLTNNNNNARAERICATLQ